MQLKSHLVGPEPLVRQPRRLDRVLAFLDPLLRFAALIVEIHHVLRGTVQVGHDEADGREQLAWMPLDLGHHPARAVPTLSLIVEAVVVAPHRLRRPAHRTVQQVADAPLEDLVAGQAYRIEETLGLQICIDLR